MRRSADSLTWLFPSAQRYWMYAGMSGTRCLIVSQEELVVKEYCGASAAMANDR